MSDQNYTIAREILEEHVKALLDCRNNTERTYEDAYDFTFKRGPQQEPWDALIELTGWTPKPEANTAPIQESEVQSGVEFDQLPHGALLYGDQWALLGTYDWSAVPASYLGTQVDDWGGFKFKRPRISNLQEIEV